MKTTKEIAEKTISTWIEKNICVHQYQTGEYRFSVRTYRFGKRPPEYVTLYEGMCIGMAANKKEFVDVIYEFLKNPEQRIKRLLTL